MKRYVIGAYMKDGAKRREEEIEVKTYNEAAASAFDLALELYSEVEGTHGRPDWQECFSMAGGDTDLADTYYMETIKHYVDYGVTEI